MPVSFASLNYMAKLIDAFGPEYYDRVSQFFSQLFNLIAILFNVNAMRIMNFGDFLCALYGFDFDLLKQ